MDFLGPRLTRDGKLFCVRTPRERPQARSVLSVARAFGDLLLFPVRVSFAILQWLNFFTTNYTGRPLTTAGRARQKGADAKQMMIWGNLLDANDSAERTQGEAEESWSVPASYQLVAGPLGGELQVLAKGVACYDLASDGRVVFSNGKAIYVRDADGQTHELVKDEHISAVVVL